MDLFTSKIRRRVSVLRKRGLLRRVDGLSVDRAISESDLDDAYNLSHQVFVDKGYILPSSTGRRIRSFEKDRRTATFVARHRGVVAGVMSIIPFTELGLPSMGCYAGEITKLQESGQKIAECGNLAVAKEYRHTSVFMELSRRCIAHVKECRFDGVVVMVGENHAPFFETVLGFHHLGGPRDCGIGVIDFVELKYLVMSEFDDHLKMVDGLLDRPYLYPWFQFL